MSFRSATPKTGDFLEVRSSGGWVPLSYVERSESLYLLASGNNARWCSHILRSGTAEMRKGGSISWCRAFLETDRSLRDSIIEEFRSKYGTVDFNHWFEKPGRLIRLQLAQNASMARQDNYFSWLESEFDSVSVEYDRHITGNSINMLLRERSLWLMGQTFHRGSSLLEIGCGSGMETIPMLREGHDIVALDISSSMLDIVRNKAKQEGLSSSLTTVKMRAGELHRLLETYSPGTFDGCYSTYGALNCEPTLKPIPETLHSLIGRDGKFVAGIFNKFCLAECLGYALSFRPGRALRRLRNPIKEGNSRFCVDVYSYTLATFSDLFACYFSPARVLGVPVLMPPSDLDSYVSKISGRFKLLNSLDLWFAGKWPFYGLGDHFLISMSRRNAAEPAIA